MRKTLVFISAFALVLVAGAALAFMTTPSVDEAHAPNSIEEPDGTSTTVHEKEEPETKETVEEPEHEEGPKKGEGYQDEPSGDEPKETDTKEEHDDDPPDLIILFPQSGDSYETGEAVFEGKTEPGAHVYAGELQADVADDGTWRIVLGLEKGWNLVYFKAFDESGNWSSASVEVYYEPPKVEPEDPPGDDEKDPPGEFEFWAEQKYGSCEENPPYDKWYGMGEPGTKITITSDFGSAEAVIGESGEWWLKVYFEAAPCNEAFLVTLTTDDGHEKHYEFIRYCEEGGEEGHTDK